MTDKPCGGLATSRIADTILFRTIMTIQECKENVGRNVTYIPFEGCDSKLHEYGVITSVNDRYAFVRYGSDVNSKATNPSDLRLG